MVNIPKSSNRALITTSLVQWMLQNQIELLKYIFDKYSPLHCSYGVELFHVNEDDGDKLAEAYLNMFKLWS